MAKRECENCDKLRICSSDCINASFAEFVTDFGNIVKVSNDRINIKNRKGAAMKRSAAIFWVMISTMVFLAPMICFGTTSSILKDIWQGTTCVTKSTIFLLRTP